MSTTVCAVHLIVSAALLLLLALPQLISGCPAAGYGTPADTYGTPAFTSAGPGVLKGISDNFLYMFPVNLPSSAAGNNIAGFSLVMGADPFHYYSTTANVGLALYADQGDFTYSLLVQSDNYVYDATTPGPYTVTIAASAAVTLPAGASLWIVITSDGSYGIYEGTGSQYESDIEYYAYAPGSPLPNPLRPFLQDYHGFDFAVAVVICPPVIVVPTYPDCGGQCCGYGTAAFEGPDSQYGEPGGIEANQLYIFPVSLPSSAAGGAVTAFGVTMGHVYLDYDTPSSAPVNVALALYAAQNDYTYSLVAQSVNYVYNASALGPYTVWMPTLSAATLPAGAALWLTITSDERVGVYTITSAEYFDVTSYDYRPGQQLPNPLEFMPYYTGFELAVGVAVCSSPQSSSSSSSSSSVAARLSSSIKSRSSKSSSPAAAKQSSSSSSPAASSRVSSSAQHEVSSSAAVSSSVRASSSSSSAVAAIRSSSSSSAPVASKQSSSVVPVSSSSPTQRAVSSTAAVSSSASSARTVSSSAAAAVSSSARAMNSSSSSSLRYSSSASRVSSSPPSSAAKFVTSSSSSQKKKKKNA